MSSVRQHLPNLFTALNLLSGCIAIMLVVHFQFEAAFLFFLIAIVADLFDGMIARLLGATSRLGAELDSLADMITSGVLPGVMAYQLMVSNGARAIEWSLSLGGHQIIVAVAPLAIVGFLITAGSAYRLAKFNLDTDQVHEFKGLPTPANALFFMGYPFLISHPMLQPLQNLLSAPYFIMGLALLSMILMNAPLRMFSFKLRSFSDYRLLFPILLILSMLPLYYFFQWGAFSLVVIVYLLLSVLKKALF
ncbi:MAG: CDP-alcohol phosphatidyltransferase family protein [Flavobacteriaceae bacterium]